VPNRLSHLPPQVSHQSGVALAGRHTCCKCYMPNIILLLWREWIDGVEALWLGFDCEERGFVCFGL
jgi:hypothetical protein